MSKVTNVAKQLTIDSREVYVVFYKGEGYKVYHELPDELKGYWNEPADSEPKGNAARRR